VPKSSRHNGWPLPPAAGVSPKPSRYNGCPRTAPIAEAKSSRPNGFRRTDAVAEVTVPFASASKSSQYNGDLRQIPIAEVSSALPYASPRPASSAADTSSYRWSDSFWPPPEEALLQAIADALAWEPPDHTDLIFDFQISAAVAEHNFAVLKNHDFDLMSILLQDLYSPI